MLVLLATVVLFATTITSVDSTTLHTTTTTPHNNPLQVTSELESLCETGANYEIPIFLGKVTKPAPTPTPTPTTMSFLFELLGGGGGHGHGPYDPNADFTDTTKWSVYPQKSQNAHIAVGVLTCFTLYIWFCNVNGLLQLSKAFMLTGVVQIIQAVYLASWVLYFLHPQDLDALWAYSLNDVMELQHLAIATCLFVTGVWDLITGWVLHFQIPIYIDSYSRQIQRRQNDRIKQPNNLLFWQRYIPIIITIGHILNGANFIKHPQHSEDNTLGHVLLGVSMMLGGFCFYWVRVRHKVWRHLTQEVYPNLQNESHMTLSHRNSAAPVISSMAVSTNGSNLNDLSRVDEALEADPAAASRFRPTPASPSSNPTAARTGGNAEAEIWNVGARYSIEDLQVLGQQRGGSRRSKFSLESFDIFAFDLTPPPKPQCAVDTTQENLDIELDSEANQLPSAEQYRSAAQSRNEWNGSILAVEYRKHLYPHLNAKFQWNSVSTHRIINYLDNARRYVLHHAWYTKTLRELVALFFASVATFNFLFIAWLLMTFIEPPEAVHMIHFYKCFVETNFAYVTFAVNGFLSALGIGYLFLTFLHYKGLVYLPSLYKIKPFQK